jgi:ribosomal protein S18 acetylase RimI-like enzyme
MRVSDQLPAFPRVAATPDISEPMLAQDVGLRTAGEDDMPYLRGLFHAIKSEELALADWPEPFKQTFLDQQFALQHRQYVGAYVSADFWIVEHRKQPIGRYYLLRDARRYHIIDIAMDRAWRGRGIGSLLLSWTQAMATQQRTAGVDLHVDERNASAQRLYTRYGFVETSRQRPYIAMGWDVS